VGNQSDDPCGSGGCRLSASELARIVGALTGVRLDEPLLTGLTDFCAMTDDGLIQVFRLLVADEPGDVVAELHALLARYRRAPSGAPAPAEGVFRRRGDYWDVVFAGRAIFVHDGKGLGYVAALLAQPGRPIPAAELVARHGGRQHGDLARISVTKAIKGALARLAALHPPLARHLTSTIRRGTACCYQPDTDQPVVWVT